MPAHEMPHKAMSEQQNKTMKVRICIKTGTPSHKTGKITIVVKHVDINTGRRWESNRNLNLPSKKLHYTTTLAYRKILCLYVSTCDNQVMDGAPDVAQTGEKSG